MRARILLAGVALAALLAACDRKPAEPPASVKVEPGAEAPAAGPIDTGLAPTAPEALPPAPSAPVAEIPVNDADDYWREAEEYADRWDDQTPSYVYDYGDEEPAVWFEGEMVRMVVERLIGGGERYYYYRPGDEYPYFVRDPDYWYGYDNGRLVSVYDYRRHRALDQAETRRRAQWAGRYAARADELRRAARRANAEERRRMDRDQYDAWRRRDDMRDRRDDGRRDRSDRDGRDRDGRDREGRDRQGRDSRPTASDQPPPPVVTPAPQPRPERPDPRDRRDRSERPDRPDRPDRTDRPDRPERPAPRAQPEPETPVVQPSPARPARPERPERPRPQPGAPAVQPRTERPERPQRPDRPRSEPAAPAAAPAADSVPTPARPRPRPRQAPTPQTPAAEPAAQPAPQAQPAAPAAKPAKPKPDPDKRERPRRDGQETTEPQ